MFTLIAVALVWVVLLWIVLHGRFGPSHAQWARAISFQPTEKASPEQLFGCLLSGNFALLMRDNFNQLASSLPAGRVARILEQYWTIRSRMDYLVELDLRLARIGEMSAPEKRAISAWLAGTALESKEYAALEATCQFMVSRARIAGLDELQETHLGVFAWDVQQVAYLVRLGLAADYVSREFADLVMDGLATRARSRYGSWKDYSLSALAGLGMRGSLEIFDSTEWMQFARTHSVLLDRRRSPISGAAPWSHPEAREIRPSRAAPLQAKLAVV